MKKHIVLAACLAAGTVTGAMAQTVVEGPWLVRARVLNLDMANRDSTGLGLSANNNTIGELDATYFFTPNIATELMLTVPQKQTVHSALQEADLGTFKHQPTTLMLQYHFTGLPGYKPYVGAGYTYTHIKAANLSSVDTELNPLTLDTHDSGGALQLGVDIPLDKNWSLNFDIKKLYIQSRVYSDGTNVGTLKLNPLVAGVGVGYRF
jgi:outer membrane protein